MLKALKHLCEFIAILVLTLASPSAEGAIIPKYTDITTRMMVYAIGIDSTDGRISITLASSNSEDPTLVDTVDADGETFFEAFSAAKNKSPKQIFLGHTSLVIVGEKAATESLSGFLDYLSRSFEVRMNAEIIVAVGCSAADIIMLPSDNGVNSLNSVDALLGDESKKISLSDVIECAANPFLDPHTAAIGIKKDEESGKETVSATGFCLFKGMILDTVLSDKMADSFSMLSGEVSEVIRTVDMEERGKLSLRVLGVAPEFTYDLSGELPKFSVSVSVTLAVAEQFRNDDSPNGISEELLEVCRDKVTTQFTDEFTLLLNSTKESGIDTLGILDRLRRLHPYKFRNYGESPDLYEKMDFDVSVTVEITNSYVLDKGA